ncbi:MAG: GIY-YIG nuclease family protein [Candidatus Doudnabacteria bacterium]|nr:GIY-YIG nuclease family protein [Candidatus Doudnabacteria bacterium]
MYYVYILKSVNHRSLYVGYTNDLRRRLKEHNEKRSKYTSLMGTWQLVYYEAYKSKRDAMKREQSLKQYGSSLGHLRRRISGSLL